MPGHLNERTLREFQVNLYRFFGEDINGLQKFVTEINERLEKLENKRPGRPKKVANG